MTEATLTFALGEDWIINATATDAAGAALNLTSLSAMEFRVASTRGLMTLADLDDGIGVVSAAAGTCQIAIAPDMQAEAAVGRWRYQWFCTIAGVDHELAAGPFIITRSLKADFPDFPTED